MDAFLSTSAVSAMSVPLTPGLFSFARAQSLDYGEELTAVEPSYNGTGVAADPALTRPGACKSEVEERALLYTHPD